MKVDVYSQQAKKLERKADLADSVFASEVKDVVLAQYVHVYLSNQRAAIAHTKDRGEVRGGGRKPWRQKGTGRARAGSSRSPIWVGGGVTFGPTNERNWHRDMPRKMRQAAIRSAFTKLAKQDAVKIIDKIELKSERLANQAQTILTAFGTPRKVTIVTADTEQDIQRAFSNVKNVNVVRVGELNAYDVVNAGQMWLLEGALEFINTKWK